MNVAEPQQQGTAGSGQRSWGLSLLAPVEPGRRNRRTVDALFLLLAAVVIGLTAVAASSAEDYDEDVARALQTVLAWANSVWRLAFVGLLVLALVVVVEVVLRRRWSLARDLLVAAMLVLGAAIVLAGAVESDWLPIESHLLSNWGYPELRLATAVSILVVAGPELARWARRLAFWSIPFATLGAVVLGAGRPTAALGALALGLGAGAVVRLGRGLPADRARARGARVARNRCRGPRPG